MPRMAESGFFFEVLSMSLSELPHLMKKDFKLLEQKPLVLFDVCHFALFFVSALNRKEEKLHAGRGCRRAADGLGTDGREFRAEFMALLKYLTRPPPPPFLCVREMRFAVHSVARAECRGARVVRYFHMMHHSLPSSHQSEAASFSHI